MEIFCPNSLQLTRFYRCPVLNKKFGSLYIRSCWSPVAIDSSTCKYSQPHERLTTANTKELHLLFAWEGILGGLVAQVWPYWCPSMLTPVRESGVWVTAVWILARFPQLTCSIIRIIRWRVELSYYQNANQDACLFFLCRVIERTKEYNTVHKWKMLTSDDVKK